MKIFAFTDGASRGNPGESGIGILLKDEAGSTIASHYGYIGQATNNIAEYSALAACLKIVQQISCTDLIVHSDSELMVRQMNGEYKVKDAALKEHFQNIKAMLNKTSYKFTIRHVPREENKEADQLANLGIDTREKLVV
jgi:ribonuclease HI